MALRRSSVKLSSLGKSNVELKMFITQLKTVRETLVSNIKAQEQAMDDMSKWAFKDENRAIQDAVERFNDLFVLWNEAQREFSACMDDFRQNFKVILEGQQGVEAAKNDYEAVEHREQKLVKELKKLSKKTGNYPNPPSEQVHQLKDLKDKLKQVSQDKDLFKMEAADRVKEQEATKLIRFKSALERMTIGYLDLVDKGDICFSSGRRIVELLPDVEDEDIERIRYTSAGATLRATIQAKALMKSFRSRNSRRQRATVLSPPRTAARARPSDTQNTSGSVRDEDQPPPPYAEVQPPINPDFNPNLRLQDRSPLHNLSDNTGIPSNGNGQVTGPFLLNSSYPCY